MRLNGYTAMQGDVCIERRPLGSFVTEGLAFLEREAQAETHNALIERVSVYWPDGSRSTYTDMAGK